MKPHQGARWSAWIIRGILFLAFTHSVVSLALLLRSPATTQKELLFGLSAVRLVIAAIFVLGGAGAIVLLGAQQFAQARFSNYTTQLQDFIHRPRNWGIFLFLSLCVTLLSVQLYLTAPELEEPVARAYSIRMQPLLFWLAGIGFLGSIALFSAPPAESYRSRIHSRVYIWIALAYVVLLTGWLWVVKTQLPRESLHPGWNDLGIPILALQVFVAWLSASLFLILITPGGRLNKVQLALTQKPFFSDISIAAVIWLLSVIMWASIPIEASWFVSEPRPPNYEYYPNSDALAYDLTAQTTLVGEGMWFANLRIVRRPMHAVFLTALHALGGQDYERVIFLQVLVLALIPAAVFWIAKSLHSRMAGILAAGIVMFREANAISLADNITASHVKLFMADLPATLAVLFFCIVALTWLRSYKTYKLSGVVCGGALAVSMLIRPELGGLLLALGLLLFIRVKAKPVLWLKNFVFPLIGLVLVITPWVLRNWNLTGLVFLDSPSFRVETLALRYQKYETALNQTPEPEPTAPAATTTEKPKITENAKPTKTPPAFENSAPVLTREEIPYLEYVARTGASLIEFARQNSASITSFISANYLHSQLQMFLMLPGTLRLPDSLLSFSGHGSPERLWQDCCSLTDYIRRLPYWHKWDGTFRRQTLLPLAVNMGLVGLGIGAAWRKFRWVGLTPLLISSVHLLVNAVFRNSGGRYILPVDWISPLYYSFGLAAASVWFFSLISEKDMRHTPGTVPVFAAPSASEKYRSVWKNPRFYILAVGLLLLGSLAPLAEAAIQPVYDDATQERMLTAFLNSNLLSEQQRSQFEDFLARGASAVAGRALFPRYYRPGQGEPGSSNPLGPQPFDRVGFYLVGPVNQAIVLPVEEPPDEFPNGVASLVIGCPGDMVYAVVIYSDPDTPESLLTAEPLPVTLQCPLTYQLGE